MKNKIKVLALASLLVLTGCGGETPSETPSEKPSETPTVSSTETPTASPTEAPTEQLKEFENIIFEDEIVTYDGKSHSLIAKNIPEFAEATYEGNEKIDAGKYQIKVKVSAEGYKDFIKTATLTIKNADFEGVTFNNVSYEYDGMPHTLVVSGFVPEGATITYRCLDHENITNTATEIGTYTIEATISAKNYNEIKLSAKLKIKTDDENRAIFKYNGKLYFQNALHNNYLYTYDGESLDFLSTDKPKDFNVLGSKLTYTSKSLLLNSIKAINFATGTKDTLQTGAISSLINDGTYYYFAINDPINKESGIYKLDVRQEEPIATCISKGKAKYLNYYGGRIYFADGENGNKLSCINVNGSMRTQLLDKKINNLIIDNGVGYFTINNLMGDYIAKADFKKSSSPVIKLTSDAGSNLQIIDNYLYYVNVDKLNTSLIGNGIYKVKTTKDTNNDLPGTKVIDGGEEGLCSLYIDGKDLYYYDVKDYNLYKYNVENDTKVGLLTGFVAPVTVPLSLGGKSLSYNNKIYYLDMYDGKTLHSYDPKTKVNLKLTSDKVSDFSIVNGILYINQVSWLVNNDLFAVNLKTPSIPTIISKNSAVDLVGDDKYIYYVEENAAGVKTAIHKANIDGSNDTIIYTKGAENLILNGKDLYFADGKIYKINDVASVNSEVEPILVNKDIHSDVFTINDGYIYFRENYGLAYKMHRLSRMKLDGTGYEELVSGGTDPAEIIVDAGYIYYANSADTANDYNLYKVKLSDKDHKKVKLTDKYYVSDMCKLDNEIYFLNYYLGGTLGDSHIYSINVNSSEVKKIA